MENIEIVEQEVVNRPNGRRNTVIITITVAVALALIIFAVYKVFSNYPFTLPSYVAFYIIILALFIFFFPLTRTVLLEYLTLKFLADKHELRPYVNDFLKDSSNSEDSIIAVKGEVRLLIALTIILILGIALFQLIVTTGADDFVKSILGVHHWSDHYHNWILFWVESFERGRRKANRYVESSGRQWIR